MIRKIIQIDDEKCNGCGACATACHEGAIGMVDGKAKLLRDDYCDGLGNCLPVCPTGAIRFVEREAEPFQAPAATQGKTENENPVACACPGTRSRTLHSGPQEAAYSEPMIAPASQLRQWPVQIKLAPVNAPYFNHAKLLVAADCSAYAYGNFHERFIRNHITLVGCPKLDGVDYAEKLTQILRANDIQSVTVVRMEVPCCGGLEHAVKTALQASGKMIPWQVVTLSTDGRILDS